MNILETNDFLRSLSESTPTDERPRDELGQAEFLELMIAQFRNQDPFEPMTNGDFLGQLAQFSTVNGITELDTSFSDLATAISGEQALQAGNIVGKDILTQSEFATHSDDDPLRGVIDLEGSASNVTVDVISVTGELIDTIALGEQFGGEIAFEWDGTTLDGDTAGEGTYQLVASVQRGDFIETVPVLVRSGVDSVSLGDPRGVLIDTSNVGSVLFGDVRRIL
ncbi:MAG: flagellar hook capping FlgD N-terminal domain-containing protein [Pseudomonadota bacterium]